MTMTITPGQTICLGYQLENDVEAVSFDKSAWITEYGPGSFQLVHRRRDDAEALPVAVTVDGGVVTWTISDADTACRGAGEAQLTYITLDGKIKKSEIYQTQVARSLVSGTDVPEPYEGWVEQVQQAAADADAAKDEANDAAERAEQAAGTAGYMFFEIDGNGDLIFSRTSNVNVDFYIDDGDLYVEAIG